MEKSNQEITRTVGEERLAIHRQRVQTFSGAARHFSIRATCRIANGGILPWSACARVQPMAVEGVVAFVPAAGAATRYLKPLVALDRALRNGQTADLLRELALLKSQGALDWALPPHVHSLLENMGRTSTSAEAKASVLAASLPKALFPCVREGITFLQMKHREHGAYHCLDGQVFIAPPGYQKTFQDHLAYESSPLPTKVYEQGLPLSTLRMDQKGSPIVDETGRLSSVPAGHGTLLKLFSAVRRDFDTVGSIFIRNIDNVSGTMHETVEQTKTFLRLNAFVLQQLQQIRTALRDQNVNLAAEKCGALLELTTITSEPNPLAGQQFKNTADPSVQRLVRVAQDLFHTPMQALPDLQQLRKLFARPLNILGQVPNTGKDVGGTPVFADVEGNTQKLCLEVPHASSQDLVTFLQDPAQATHFNPVLVAAELTTEAFPIQDEAHPFWIVAKKQFGGQDVFYQETLLYELLGSSQFANVLFLEILRSLFNPHKTLADTAGKTLGDWMPPNA